MILTGDRFDVELYEPSLLLFFLVEYVSELLTAEMSVQIFFLGGRRSVHPYSIEINDCEWSTEDGKDEGN